MSISTPLIQIKNFYKSFGAKAVHQGVSLELNKGECLGLLGGSGTGKSVLLRSLIGLEHADRGELYFEGENLTQLSEKNFFKIRKKIAYAFQGGALFDSMTVFENLAFPLREHTHLNKMEIALKIKATLEEFGLQGNENLYPSQISGGMQKRLGLARAIITDPEVILYDEPTAGLDPYNTRRIQEMMMMLKRKGVSSILVTHDMPVAFAVCDQIALLLGGKIVAQGSPQKLNSEFLQKFSQGESI